MSESSTNWTTAISIRSHGRRWRSNVNNSVQLVEPILRFIILKLHRQFSQWKKAL